jgi:hypothetical protein
MPSTANADLMLRLRDVAEIIAAHEALTGGGRGRPALRQGAAITRAGIVLLAAATEAFVEDLFEEAAGLVFVGMPAADLQKLFNNTSKRLNNADVHKVELLFFNLGMPWALRNMSWKKFSNPTLRADLNALIQTRNRIAHGDNTEALRLASLRRWKNMIEMFASRFETKVADHVQTTTGHRPAW